MYVFENCINDFIVALHCVHGNLNNTHSMNHCVKIFTLVLQVSDSMMSLLVHIFHVYCNICTRHICDIYVTYIYVTDIYVTYMSVTHIITICLLPHLHLKYKYVIYI